MAIVPTPLHPIKTKAQQIIERRIGQKLEQALHRLYVVKGMNQDGIAAEWGIERSTVSRWMKDFGIESRQTGPRIQRKASA